MPRHVLFVYAALSAALSAIVSLLAPAQAQSTVETSARAEHGWLDAPYHNDRPIHVMSTSKTVQTDDLDLNAPEDRRELRRRIRAAAIEACRAIDSASADVLIDSDYACVRQASREARRALEMRERRAR